MRLFSKFRQKMGLDESSGDECEDESANTLSYVGTAAYDVLRRHHNHHHHELWNVTHGKVVELDSTPRDAFTRSSQNDPREGHDDWLPEKVQELISRTEEWCDILTLAPPDGLFLDAFKNGLRALCEKDAVLNHKIIVRMMFGNIVAAPVNCTKLIAELTRDLPPNAGDKIKLWVGSWRKGVSWNHAKIIAIDGKYLWTGGHNFWTRHYLKKNPVNDLSIEMQGNVARDGHRYANSQWAYIVKKQSTAWGKFVDRKISDSIDVPRKARVTVSEFPEGSAAEFPPLYNPKNSRLQEVRIVRGPQRSNIPKDSDEFVPVITLGRYGTLLKNARPSDDAFVAIFDSAKTIIRCALQDLGPLCVPKTKLTLPGLVWPTKYLNALARVIWTKGVDVEIVLSNPGSVPDHDLAGQYGNGWCCVDVAAEIIKSIRTQFPDAPDDKLRYTVEQNLRVCFLRCRSGGSHYSDGSSLGLHSKHFIVDDICCYIGSQNLYICDLAEWGVLIDSRKAVKEIKREYWDQMWEVSYTTDDCNVDAVMDGLGIDRSAPSKLSMTRFELLQAHNAAKVTIQQFLERDSESEQSDAADEDEEKEKKGK